jgi:hypothetical protein
MQILYSIYNKIKPARRHRGGRRHRRGVRPPHDFEIRWEKIQKRLKEKKSILKPIVVVVVVVLSLCTVLYLLVLGMHGACENPSIQHQDRTNNACGNRRAWVCIVAVSCNATTGRIESSN